MNRKQTLPARPAKVSSRSGWQWWLAEALNSKPKHEATPKPWLKPQARKNPATTDNPQVVGMSPRNPEPKKQSFCHCQGLGRSGSSSP